METNRYLSLEERNRQLENEVKHLENELNLLKKRTYSLDLRNRDLQKRYRLPTRKHKGVQVDNRKSECFSDHTSDTDDSGEEKHHFSNEDIEKKVKKLEDVSEKSDLEKQITCDEMDTDNDKFTRSEIKFIIDETRSDYFYSKAEKYPYVTTLILEGNSWCHYTIDKHSTAALNLSTLIYLCAEKFQFIENLKLVNIGWKLEVADVYLIANCFSSLQSLSLFWVEVSDEHVAIFLDKLEHLKKIEVIGVPITGQCFDNLKRDIETLTWRFCDRVRTYQEFKFN